MSLSSFFALYHACSFVAFIEANHIRCFMASSYASEVTSEPQGFGDFDNGVDSDAIFVFIKKFVCLFSVHFLVSSKKCFFLRLRQSVPCGSDRL